MHPLSETFVNGVPITENPDFPHAVIRKYRATSEQREEINAWLAEILGRVVYGVNYEWYGPLDEQMQAVYCFSCPQEAFEFKMRFA